MAEAAGRKTEFDYVIIGGGSAGCVLANRLSADPSIRVLLLEAGGWDRDLRMRIPAGVSRLGDAYDWGYEGQPDPSRNDKVDVWDAGKVLGGGSSVNMMLWVRGDRSDFDGWRDQGCEGWGYDDVLPYFVRAETFAGEMSPFRGRSGPVGVTRPSTPLEVCDDFLAAAEAAGHVRNPDYNGERQQGVSVAQVNQRRGLRSSTARAYLAPVRKRSNLSIATEALVERIRIEDGRALGVEYLHEGQSHWAAASGEVILSAGALASPKLLMLSGVGPAAQLEAHGIEVEVDAPGVGQNLQDHAYAMMMFSTEADTLAEEMRPLKMLKHGLDFIVRRKGALTSSGCTAVVFTQLAGEQPTECEIILIPIGMQFQDSEGAATTDHSTKAKMLPHSMMVYPSYVHPTSRGSVELASADPAAPPLLKHSLLDGDDMGALIAACRKTREIFEAGPMKTKNVMELIPGEGVQSDEEWTGYLRQGSFRPYHPVGTCRMGADEDSVVDPKLRVRGVEGLRVVDASIFPTITSGNTNAPTIMVAERAVDLILQNSSSRREA
jgi:choline dehydrogenase-like flavoprotein